MLLYGKPGKQVLQLNTETGKEKIWALKSNSTGATVTKPIKPLL